MWVHLDEVGGLSTWREFIPKEKLSIQNILPQVDADRNNDSNDVID